MAPHAVARQVVLDWLTATVVHARATVGAEVLVDRPPYLMLRELIEEALIDG